MATHVADTDNEQEEDSLIPDYIELTEDEDQCLSDLLDMQLSANPNDVKFGNVVVAVIEKLVNKIEQQNEVIEKTALQLVELMKKMST